MELRKLTPEEYAKRYNLTKEEVLLPDDITLIKQITAEVARFPTLTNAGELIDLESNLTEMSYRFAGLIGRLSSQYEIHSKELKADMARWSKSKVDSGEEKSMARADASAEEEFMQRRLELEVFGGIVDEYKGKSYALKDIFLALTHRIHKFSNQ